MKLTASQWYLSLDLDDTQEWGRYMCLSWNGWKDVDWGYHDCMLGGVKFCSFAIGPVCIGWSL